MDSTLSRPAEEFDNDGMVEALFAKKAFEHSELHFNLLCSVNPRDLKLTPFDDIIYKTFRENFPEMSVGVLDEEKDFKSENAKVRWRKFIENFNKLDDYNFGTLLRADASKKCDPDNSIFVVRIQFLAVEIARNREGCNDAIKQNHAK